MRPTHLTMSSLAGVAVALAGLPASAQDAPRFHLLRYQDDLSSLIAAPQSDWRFHELGDHARVSFGGELRTRLERTSQPSLGRLGDGADVYGLHRALLHADLRLDGGWRAFIQIGAFPSTDKAVALPPAHDALDLQQGFIELSRPIGQGRGLARFGRQEIALGSQRLVALRDGPNARRTFDGARATYRREDLTVEVLALRPVEQRRGVFDNRTADHEALTGVYATLRAPGSLPGALDLYALGYERPYAVFASASGAERRWSWGARAFGRDGGWDWDLEATVQTGRVGRRDVFAWGFATDSGYTRAFGPVRARLGLKADIASGDHDAGDDTLNTANAMYPKLPYLGSAGAFAPANIIDLQPSLTLSRDALAVTVGYQAIWRQTTADAVYVAPLIPLVDTAGRAGRFSGHQWPIDLMWRPSPSWQLDASVAWVEVSRDLKRAGAKDSTFAFASLTYRF